MDKQTTGKQGEKIAEDFLVKQGYKVLDRRFQVRFGEIDLIVQKNNTLVFVEVKARFGERCGRPEESVTIHKIRKMKNVALKYLQITQLNDMDLRLDCIAIDLNFRNQCVNIRHYENIGY